MYEEGPVDRLYHRLADAMQRTRENAFGTPVTIAEIYQELVPYRIVRTEIGFDMNADYEHALMRLLGGEGNRVRLEPPHAREVIARELKSPNPNVSMYREFAGCDAWVSPPGDNVSAAFAAARDILDDILDDGSTDGASTDDRTTGAALQTDEDWSELERLGADVDDEPADSATFALVEGDEPARVAEPLPEPVRGTGGAAAPSSAASAAARCPFCDSRLPTHRSIRFCPYCGHDQTTRPCNACGEALEPGWVFCATCGLSSAAT